MILKWTRFIIYFIFYATTVILIRLLPVSDLRRRKISSQFLSWISKKTLTLLGIHVVFENSENLTPPFLITCNHISYLDALVVQSIFPCVMITSKEIEATPVLGFMTRGAGCIFVERRNRTTLDRDNQEIQKTLDGGVNVVLFPEGTSTNGQNLLPFKSGLFDSARFSNKKVLPLCLKYLKVDQEQYSTENLNDVAYYSDMTFFSHLKRLMKRKEIIASLEVLKPLEAAEYPNRKDLSVECYQRTYERFYQENRI